jgi:hypothetical protein
MRGRGPDLRDTDGPGIEPIIGSSTLLRVDDSTVPSASKLYFCQHHPSYLAPKRREILVLVIMHCEDQHRRRK